MAEGEQHRVRRGGRAGHPTGPIHSFTTSYIFIIVFFFFTNFLFQFFKSDFLFFIFKNKYYFIIFLKNLSKSYEFYFIFTYILNFKILFLNIEF